MSSRDTFVTSYLYKEEAAEIVTEVLKGRCHVIVNHGRWVSGWGKSIGRDYSQILTDCRQALKSIDYEIPFELVIVDDDDPYVHHTKSDY